VNGGDMWRLIAERDYLSQRLDEMERLMAVAEAEIEKLRGENGELKEENKTLRHQLKQMLGKIFKRQVKSDHDADRPKRGAPCGHRGNSRRRPEEISELVDIYPEKCDQCGGQVSGYPDTFDEHVVEDIEIKKRVTCYRFHYGYCKRCQKVVRAKANGAGNPNDRIGVQARAVGGYLRYLGLTYRKAARLFKNVFDLDLTHPSFMAFSTEQAQNGVSIYEGIKQSIRHSPYVNADETGWRVNGQNHWLWVFANKDAALYHIDKSRGGKVVTNILGQKYQGVLGCDFYSAYNELDATAKQRCLGHLLSEIKKVQEKNQFAPESIDGIFCHELKTVLKQLIDVRNKHREGAGVFDALTRAKNRAIPKMTDLLSSPIEHEDTQRLRKRIIRHNQELFIFLDDLSIEPTNNRAERQLRPMVIMRKLTFGNRSESGASNQALIMSIVETGVLNDVELLDIFRALSVKPLTSFVELPKARPP
jgi:regulator of replication initiation timing